MEILFAHIARQPASSPARGTWIEILAGSRWKTRGLVVPRKGDVDRNVRGRAPNCALWVVPRKGDVDRNTLDEMQYADSPQSSPARGTWIEIRTDTTKEQTRRSSPARGTWIEIWWWKSKIIARQSSPARGTWIEIQP